MEPYLAHSRSKDGKVWTQSKGQGADGVQGVSAKRILAAVQDTQEGVEDGAAVACQVHGWQQPAAADQSRSSDLDSCHCHPWACSNTIIWLYIACPYICVAVVLQTTLL